jgi:hypothetical protein
LIEYREKLMQYVAAFVAGFLSTLIFHQGTVALFYALGAAKEPPYSRKPTAPFGVPEVLSLALWGGAWAVLLWLAVHGLGGGWPYWVCAVVGAAIVPTIVTFLVVFPLKGERVEASRLVVMIAGILILNGAWGLGVAIMMSLFRQFFATS